MPRKLVFIHGRAQQRKDSIALKQEWISSLREGLRKSGLPLPISEEDIRFPYYGDTLEQLSSGMNQSDAANVIIRGPESEEEEEFMRDVLAEVKAKAGITDAEVLAELDPAVVDRRSAFTMPWWRIEEPDCGPTMPRVGSHRKQNRPAPTLCDRWRPERWPNGRQGAGDHDPQWLAGGRRWLLCHLVSHYVTYSTKRSGRKESWFGRLAWLMLIRPVRWVLCSPHLFGGVIIDGKCIGNRIARS